MKNSEWGILQTGDSNISYRLVEADKTEHYAIIIPGYGDHINLYDNLQRNLHNTTSIAIDLRGHGSSEGPRYYVSSFDDYCHDIDRAVEFLTERFGKVKFTLIGHSQGGMAIHHYALKGKCASRIEGASLIAPFYDFSDDVKPSKVLELMMKLANFVIPKVTFPNKGVSAASCTNDEFWIDALNKDPVYANGKFTIGWGLAAQAASKYAFAKKNVDSFPSIPVQFITAEGETVVANDATLKMFELIKRKNEKTQHVWANGKHKLLQSSDAPRVIQHVNEFMNDVKHCGG